jgi:hypothetical protein
MRGNKVAILVGTGLILLVVYLVSRQVREHYLQDDPVLKVLDTNFRKFFRQDRYWEYPLDVLNKRNVMDEIDLYRGNKSYTINKQKVYLCLKDQNKQYYNQNMLTYVLAHEIAHVINNEIGHTEKFNTIFDALLVKMANEGLYDPTKRIDDEYCALGDDEVAK